MMRKILTVAAAAFLAVGLSACSEGGGGRNVELTPPQMVSVPAGTSLDAMHDAILRGARDRSWNVSRDEPGRVTLRIDSRSHMAVVAVPYSPSGFTVEYVDSQNLNYVQNNGKRYIHPTYYRWVRNLEQSIQRNTPIHSGAPRAYR